MDFAKFMYMFAFFAFALLLSRQDARAVLRALDVVAKLPVLKQLNGLLGVAAGAVQGLLWVLFAVAALRLVADMGWIDALTPAVLEDTVLVRYLDGWMA